jgi:hypothetical protein
MEIGKPTTVDVKEPANEGQIGGNHYKKLQIQPWDYILANNIGYCEGSAIKYLSPGGRTRAAYKTSTKPSIL